MIMNVSKNIFSLYNSTLYRLIVIGYACLGIHTCFVHKDTQELATGILLLCVSIAYHLSIKIKSYFLMWVVLFIQIALAIYLV